MATQRRRFELKTSPTDATRACRVALSKLAWEVAAQEDGPGLTGEELPWHLTCLTQPARVEIEILARAPAESTIALEGSMRGRGPIQTKHLTDRLASLESQIRLEAESRG